MANDTAVVKYDELIISLDDVIRTIESAGFDAFVKDENVKTLTLSVEGMTCATCAGNVDHVVKKIRRCY